MNRFKLRIVFQTLVIAAVCIAAAKKDRLLLDSIDAYQNIRSTLYKPTFGKELESFGSSAVPLNANDPKRIQALQTLYDLGKKLEKRSWSVSLSNEKNAIDNFYAALTRFHVAHLAALNHALDIHHNNSAAGYDYNEIRKLESHSLSLSPETSPFIRSGNQTNTSYTEIVLENGILNLKFRPSRMETETIESNVLSSAKNWKQFYKLVYLTETRPRLRNRALLESIDRKNKPQLLNFENADVYSIAHAKPVSAFTHPSVKEGPFFTFAWANAQMAALHKLSELKNIPLLEESSVHEIAALIFTTPKLNPGGTEPFEIPGAPYTNLELSEKRAELKQIFSSKLIQATAASENNTVPFLKNFVAQKQGSLHHSIADILSQALVQQHLTALSIAAIETLESLGKIPYIESGSDLYLKRLTLYYAWLSDYLRREGKIQTFTAEAKKEIQNAFVQQAKSLFIKEIIASVAEIAMQQALPFMDAKSRLNEIQHFQFTSHKPDDSQIRLVPIEKSPFSKSTVTQELVFSSLEAKFQNKTNSKSTNEIDLRILRDFEKTFARIHFENATQNLAETAIQATAEMRAQIQQEMNQLKSDLDQLEKRPQPISDHPSANQARNQFIMDLNRKILDCAVALKTLDQVLKEIGLNHDQKTVRPWSTVFEYKQALQTYLSNSEGAIPLVAQEPEALGFLFTAFNPTSRKFNRSMVQSMVEQWLRRIGNRDLEALKILMQSSLKLDPGAEQNIAFRQLTRVSRSKLVYEDKILENLNHELETKFRTKFETIWQDRLEKPLAMLFTIITVGALIYVLGAVVLAWNVAGTVSWAVFKTVAKQAATLAMNVSFGPTLSGTLGIAISLSYSIGYFNQYNLLGAKEIQVLQNSKASFLNLDQRLGISNDQMTILKQQQTFSEVLGYVCIATDSVGVVTNGLSIFAKLKLTPVEVIAETINVGTFGQQFLEEHLKIRFAKPQQTPPGAHP